MAGQWFYTVNRQQQGPVSWEDLYRLAQGGGLQPADMVWQEGMANWVKAKATPGLFDDVGSGRRADEEDAPRRSRRHDEDDDRPRRARDLDDGVDDDVGGDRPRRRRPKETGMPVGLKVGLIIGGVVVALLVVGVILIMVLRPGETNQGVFEVPGGATGLLKNGTLSNSDGNDRTQRGPCHVYQVKMVANRTYTIDLESNQFDAYLRIENSNQFELAANDDFMGLNSRIVFTAPTTGTYRVIATSLAGMGRGAYTLRVREGNQNNNFQKGWK